MRARLMLDLAAAAAMVVAPAVRRRRRLERMPALTGIVSSEAEGAMEGVVVTASKARLDRHGRA